MTAKPQSTRRLNFEWIYVGAAISAFVFAPELRRLVEWRLGGFSSIDVISPIPLFMLLPIAFVALRRSARLNKSPFVWLVGIWLVAFGYAFVVGWVNQELMPAVYGLALFVLPVSVSAWLLTLDASLADSFGRLTIVLYACGFVAGSYGVLQFVFAPPWDTAWMQAIQATSFGEPVPFGIRVFGVLNSPQTFALFIGAVLILTTATVSLRRWWLTLPATMIMALSLMLTLVRTVWIEVAVSIVLILILNPRRLQALASLVAICAVAALGLLAFIAIVPSQGVAESLALRFNTLAAINEDGSAVERADASNEGLRAAIGHPIGVGLGLMGESNKLANKTLMAFDPLENPGLDNGYVSRFYEQGVFGFSCFLATIFLSLCITVDSYWRSIRFAKADQGIISTCLAFQIGILITLFGDDSLQGLSGLLYFVSVALPLIASRERLSFNRNELKRALPVMDGRASWVSLHSRLR